MFDFMSFSEIIVILIIALIFLGPKQIPNIAKALGKLIAKIKYYSNYIQDNFVNYVHNDEYIENITQSAKELKQEITSNLQEIKHNIQATKNIQNNIDQNKHNYNEYLDANLLNTKINIMTKRSLYLRSLAQRKLLIQNVKFNNYKKYKLLRKG